jgi:RNA polymerase sigma factor (sigma-70 family)
MLTEAKIIHTDQRFITGLLQNDAVVVREIYARFSGKIKNYILQNSGTEEDAADVLQEALIAIYQQARYKNLQLSCPFEPFLLLICRRKWLNEIKKLNRRGVTINTDDLSFIGEDVFFDAEQLQAQNDKASLYLEMFNKLGERCREIISKCLGTAPQEEISRELGVSYAYLRKKKSECTAELVNLIKAKMAS